MDADAQDDPFPEIEGVTDLALIVGDKTFHINKSVLLTCSPVFRTMFTTDFRERDAKEVRLEDEPAAFLEFLSSLYPSVLKPISSDNIFNVLELADKYQVDSLMGKCDDFLEMYFRMTTEDIEGRLIIKYIEAAEKYTLKKSLPVLLKKAVKVSSNTVLKSEITDENKIQILSRRLRVYEKLDYDLHNLWTNATYRPSSSKSKYEQMYEKYDAFCDKGSTYWKNA